jgi:hypothetical protein
MTLTHTCKNMHLQVWVWVFGVVQVACGTVPEGIQKIVQVYGCVIELSPAKHTGSTEVCHYVNNKQGFILFRPLKTQTTSQPSGSSSTSAPLPTSSVVREALMSLSLTRLRALQWPRHKRAHVEWMESWLQTCERRRLVLQQLEPMIFQKFAKNLKIFR